jgi:ABC-type phosphate transport system substrate-binding protein
MTSSSQQKKYINMHLRPSLCFLLFLALLNWALVSEDAVASDTTGTSLVVVANRDFKISKLTKSEVEEIFLQKRVSGLGQQSFVPVFLPDTSSAAVAFADKVLGKSVKQLRAYWNLKVLTGRLKPPIVVDSPEEVITFLNRNSGSLGYLDESFVKEGLKVLYEVGNP